MKISTELERLSKLGLMASDSSYGALAKVFVGNALAELPDTPTYDFRAPYLVEPGFKVEALGQHAGTGFKYVAYRNDTTNEVIIAMAGTDGPNFQDWGENLMLGWRQWETPGAGRDQVFDYLASIERQGFNGKVHFTGQSLGGALAEYAAFEYFDERISTNPNIAERMSLVTFNGLASRDGLAFYGEKPHESIKAFDNAFAALAKTGKQHVAHYFVTNDVIHRIGGGHIGGPLYEFHFTSERIDPQSGRPFLMDPVDAHRLETGFYRPLALQVTDRPFFNNAVERADDSLPIANAQTLLGYFVGLFNAKGTTELSARYRIFAALTLAVTHIDNAEMALAFGELLPALRDSGVIGHATYKVFSENIGVVLQEVKAAGSAARDEAVMAILMALYIEKPELWSQKEFTAMTAILPSEPKAVLALIDGAFYEKPADDRYAAAYAILDLIAAGDPEQRAFFDNAGLSAKEITHIAMHEPDWLGALHRYLFGLVKDRPENIPRMQAMLAALVDEQARRTLQPVLTELNATALGTLESARASAAYLETLQNRLLGHVKGWGRAVANALDDFTTKFAEITYALPDALAAEDIRILTRGYEQQLRNGALDGFVRAALEESKLIVELAGQTIVIRKGAPENPFNDVSFSADMPVELSGINESQVKTFTAFVPYRAGAGGQRITLSLQGAAANTFKVLVDDGELSIGADGRFSLRIPEGHRSVTFGLWAKGDVDVDQTLALSATLVDATGVATHKTHLELNLALDAIDEGAAPGAVVNGTPNPDDLSTSSLDGRTLNGLGGNDLVRGGVGNDVVNGGIGNDYLLGGKGDDRMFGGDGNDFTVLGAGTDYAEGGAGDDFFGYWGFDITPLTLLTVGGWPANFGVDFKWQAALGINTSTGNYELADLVVIGPSVLDVITGLVKGAERLALPNYTVDLANRDSHTVLGGAGNDLIVAGRNDDTIFGDDGDDTLLGMRGDDTLFGGLGADRLAGNVGNDYLDGGAGNDTLDGEDGDDTLLGGAGSDTLRGDIHSATASFANHGDDYLDGGDGDDLLIGHGGDDTLFGGEGVDYLHGDADFVPIAFQGDDYLDGEGGNDFLFGYGGDDDLFGGTGLDELQGGAGNDYLDGEADGDRLFGEAGDDDLFGGTGDDLLQGGTGKDHLDGEDGVDRLFGEQGDDTLIGGAGNDMLDGGVDNDTLYGGLDDDELFGRDGNDVLGGGGGADWLRGGAGNDTYLFGHGDGHDFVDEPGTPGERNIVRLGSAVSPNAVTLTRSLSGALVIGLNNGADELTTAQAWYTESNPQDWTATGINTIAEIQFSDGTVWNAKTIAAKLNAPTNGDDNLTGVGADDEIRGGAGHDRISGNLGDDLLLGEFGNDTISGGRGADLLFGGDGADVLVGDEDADVLDGGAGNDSLVGGKGDDVYLFGRGYGRDVIDEDAADVRHTDAIVFGAGVRPEDIVVVRGGDTVGLYITDTLDDMIVFYGGPGVASPVIERFVFENGVTWVAADVSQRLGASYTPPTQPVLPPGVATAGRDFIEGTAAADVLDGLGGNDRLQGYGGNDRLFGSAGDDHLSGDAGDDFLDGGSGSDTLYGGIGNDALYGSAEDDSLNGSFGDDLLDGGSGADRMLGGHGNDMPLERTSRTSRSPGPPQSTVAATTATMCSPATARTTVSRARRETTR